jgi:hypothetical protein
MSKDSPHRFERITPRVSMRRGFLHLEGRNSGEQVERKPDGSP